MSNVQTHSLLLISTSICLKAGKHYRLYEKLGAHLIEKDIKAFILLFGLLQRQVFR
jgi:hypothetical protein